MGNVPSCPQSGLKGSGDVEGQIWRPQGASSTMPYPVSGHGSGEEEGSVGTVGGWGDACAKTDLG